MPQTHLELQPAYGDETIGGLHFVLRGDSAEASGAISREGLRFTPGEACVSANLLGAHKKSDRDTGRISVVTLSPEFHVGYPVMDTAFISRADKMVMGAPMRYGRAREDLSLYGSSDTEGERNKIESEILNGSPLADHASFTIGARNVLGSFAASTQLESVLARLKVSIEGLEAIEYGNIERALVEMFDCQEPAQAVLVPTMVHALVIEMAESVMISKMRRMRWEGLAALGYSFKEGSEVVDVPHKDVRQQREAMDECHKQIEAGGIFAGELAWLKAYTLRQLELMRIELDGAELEAA